MGPIRSFFCSEPSRSFCLTPRESLSSYSDLVASTRSVPCDLSGLISGHSPRIHCFSHTGLCGIPEDSEHTSVIPSNSCRAVFLIGRLLLTWLLSVRSSPPHNPFPFPSFIFHIAFIHMSCLVLVHHRSSPAKDAGQAYCSTPSA